MNLALKAAIVGIVLNVLLPFILTPLATPEEVKPKVALEAYHLKDNLCI